MRNIRVVSYAINGRGMGHLVRQLAILRWIRRFSSAIAIRAECWVLTSSEADTLARREGVPALKMPSKAMLRDAGLEPSRYLSIIRTWVMNAIAGLQPDLLIVDTFPGGSVGELVPCLELARCRVLVARQVRPDFAQQDHYRALLPLYDDVYAPEEGGGPILIRERAELLPRQEARRRLGILKGSRAVYVSLGGGGDPTASTTLPHLVDLLLGQNWHVVVGAGPLYGGEERRGNGITWLDRYVPMELFPGVDAAVSAGGYNSFHELMFVGVPTVFLPQPRIADDQMARVRRAEAAGAGRIANTLAEVPQLLEAPGTSEAARALVPQNGAREAALRLLSTLVPPGDLKLASEMLTDEVLGLFHRVDSSKKALELVRLLAGGTPSEQMQRRATLLQAGHDAPPEVDASERVHRFAALCAEHRVDLDCAIHLTKTLARKFPAADGEALLAAVEKLFPIWAPFDDWMGAVSLLRAIPAQRALELSAFAVALSSWLTTQEDLFDALREFSHLEGNGVRSVAEVLQMLQDKGAP
ncbi:MAG: hypothetical protein HN348_10855 [Proteobacteria bacterium]|nr:hypothetical protein [Pseudomonadota bacterium]